MRVMSLGSGSSGNALLVEAGPGGRTKLLVDAGLPYRTLVERLRCAGVSPAQLRGVLLTHEHSDHMLGLPQLQKQYATPVIADPRTLAAVEQAMQTFISWRRNSGELIVNGTDGQRERSVDEAFNGAEQPAGGLRATLTLTAGSSCVLGDVEVCSFPVPHDAAAPCGYLLSAGGCRVCIVIDSGEVTPTMLDMMRLADLLILESNHDRERLLRGPYAYPLKMRILSPTGHLSNDQAATAVLRTWRSDSVRWLWLSHLSRTNNTPRLALQSMRERLQAAGASLSQVHISVLPPGAGGIWDSTQLWHASHLWEMHE